MKFDLLGKNSKQVKNRKAQPFFEEGVYYQPRSDMSLTDTNGNTVKLSRIGNYLCEEEDGRFCLYVDGSLCPVSSKNSRNFHKGY